MINGSFFMVVILTMISWGIYRFVVFKNNKSINKLREFVLFIFLIYFLILLSITVFKGFSIEFHNQFNSYMYKSEGIFGIVNIIPLKDTIETISNGNVPIKMPLSNIFGNILIFTPLGFIIPMLFSKYDKFLKIVILGFTSSLCIEIVQLFVGYNVCDIDDLLFNTTGAILGFVCYKLFKNLVNKFKFTDKLKSINDDNTEHIFKKSTKVIIVIGVFVLISYVYGFYTQTKSEKLSDEELAKQLFRNGDSEIVDSKDFGDRKFYLLKDENGVGVQSLIKYSNTRYANTYEGHGFYPSDDVGYDIDLIHDYENEDQGHVSTISVVGKNSNADKLIISLFEKEHEVKLKHNEYFFEIYPEYMKLDEDFINEIYNGKKSDNIKIKFIDKDGNEVTDIEQIKVQY